MQLDVRTILLLRHPDRDQVLLLRRSPDKKLFPGLITGIGGAVELASGEGADLEAALLRELEEETRIARGEISDLRLRLATVLNRECAMVLLLWHTAKMSKIPSDLSCTEGHLSFFPVKDLPVDLMIPTAREAIPFVLSLADDDLRTYSGVYDGKTFGLLANRSRGGG